MPRRKQFRPQAAAPKPVEAPKPEPVKDRAAEALAHNRGMSLNVIDAARLPDIKPAVYKIGPDYFCVIMDGEELSNDPLFSNGWQLIEKNPGNSIHRARG